MNEQQTGAPLIYSARARRFHWVTVAFLVLLYPIGFYMDYRGNDLNIWDATTDNLYSVHKLLGFVLLLFIVLPRFVFRVLAGAPADEPGLEWWQKVASHATHWALYALLIAVPLGGWIGVQLFGARDVFGLFKLPGFLAENQDAAARVFGLHKLGALLMLALVAAHVGAALFHHFVRKDGVLRRMLPKRDGQ